jgi:hypothetical protein
MSRAHKGGFTPKKDTTFPVDFFGALQIGDEDEALECLRSEAIPGGDQPSPRAQALIKSGEWDSNQKLALVLVESNACTGRIGNDDYRFCGKPKNFCAASTHTKITVGEIQRGWYISIGKAHGLLTTPFLPTLEDGGPITTLIAARFLSADNAFKLSKGQWKFVIDSWYAIQADISVSDFSLQSEASKTRIGKEAGSKSEGQPILNIKTIESDILESTTRDAVFPLPLERLGGNEAHLAELFLALKQENERSMQDTIALRDIVTQLRAETRELQAVNEFLKAEAQQQKARTGHLEQDVRAIHSQHGDEMKTLQLHLRATKERMVTLEAAVEKNSNSSTLGAGNQNQFPEGLVDKVTELDAAMFSATGSFTRFKTSFLEFKEKLESGGGIECNGVAFKSQRDFLKWFEEEKPTIDIFLDAIAFMHGISAPVVHSDDAIKQIELQMKTDIATGLEATVLTSFATILPSILVGSGGKKADATMGGTYAWLSGYLKKFEVWKPIGSVNGVSHQITSGVENVSRRVVELRKQFANSNILMLSQGICQDSSNFCRELVNFINDQQEELTSNTPYTAEQVWQMQLECLQKIIEELSDARSCYREAGQAARGNYIWGMLMAWKVQQRYRENHFKDDPALTGILVRRILMQGQDSSVKKQLQKVDANEIKIENYKRENNSAVKAIKDEVSKLKDDIGRLKK